MNEKQTLTVRKRAAIVEAAIDEFLEKGFRTASMDAIAKRAEVSKRTVYNHFESKEALFQAIAHQLIEHRAEMTRIEYQPAVPLADQLLDFAHKELALLRSDRFLAIARMMLAEFMSSPALAMHAMEKMDQQVEGLQLLIVAAVKGGQLKPVDPDYAANQFIGLIKANAFWPQLLSGQAIPDAELSERIAQDAVMMFLARYT